MDTYTAGILPAYSACARCMSLDTRWERIIPAPMDTYFRLLRRAAEEDQSLDAKGLIAPSPEYLIA